MGRLVYFPSPGGSWGSVSHPYLSYTPMSTVPVVGPHDFDHFALSSHGAPLGQTPSNPRQLEPWEEMKLY